MGAVFRATDEKLGRTVAVKVLSRNRKDVDSLRRFKNEAQSAARLDHPNIARVFYVGEDAGWNFIVFEYI
ncbi:MAG TPA: serine/threonine-protein kinase, partial [Planctomycetaceae bacterium]|nr:serine/threonine-protein kinase [Planctomycetaceae bacterium]